MFIDTSAIVAILSKDPDATEFANKIEAAARCTGAPGARVAPHVRMPKM